MNKVLKKQLVNLIFCAPLSVVFTATLQAKENVFFDDFSYQNPENFKHNKWNIRTEKGHPGLPGATWSEKGVSFHNDTEGSLHGVVRLTSQTDGSGKNTQHTQICHERKYLEGTYAARVFFRNEPTFGPDGDEVIQTFYAISPLKAPMDPDYSETDFEYLPNGGWGQGPASAMWTTTWETFQLKPWTKVNEYTREEGDFGGWHTLMLTVMDNRVTYYVDGKLHSTHSEKVAPEVPMSMNFNLWFMPKGPEGSLGPVDSDTMRQYQQDIDWAFHQAGKVLTPDQVETTVAKLRKNNVTFVDNVSHPSTPLPSYCGL